MKIFHAIDDPGIIPIFHDKTGIKLNIIISYHYLPGSAYKLIRLCRKMIDLLYLDSGAFSAEKSRVKISLPEFRRYIRRYGHYYDAIFSLDDNFSNPDANFNNQVYLEEDLPEGIQRPVPVLHDRDNPFEEFKLYADDGHKFIAIGSNNTNIPDDIYQKMKDEYPEVDLHLFGKLNRKKLLTVKPYSADASTWAIQAAYGCVYYWDPGEEKEYQIYVGEKERKDKKITHFNKFPRKEELENFLSDKFGYEYTNLLSDTNAKRVVNLYFFKQLEDYINAN